jgi:hypothetical protein
MAKSVMAAFRARAEAAGAEFSDVLIHGAIDGEANQQDSRIFRLPRRTTEG